MDAQSIIGESRLLHVRELKTENARLKAEVVALREELSAFEAHFDLALTAAEDLKALPEGGRLIIVDGWNLILGAGREAHDRKELEAQWRRYLEEHPLDAVWIVLDGSRFATESSGRLRITYTGGIGLHRADRFICDFLRMAAYRGSLADIEVKTRDKDFLKTLERLRRSSCRGGKTNGEIR